MHLTGKRALFTSAARGIGGAITSMFRTVGAQW